MLGIATFPTFHEAYIAVLDATTNRPDHTIATRGNTSAELLNVSYRITDPRDRLPFLTRRPVNIAYNLAEALWYLSGRCDLDMIGYYAPGMANYSADGHTLTGTAYGRALFARGQDGHTQWDRSWTCCAATLTANGPCWDSSALPNLRSKRIRTCRVRSPPSSCCAKTGCT